MIFDGPKEHRVARARSETPGGRSRINWNDPTFQLFLQRQMHCAAEGSQGGELVQQGERIDPIKVI